MKKFIKFVLVLIFVISFPIITNADTELLEQTESTIRFTLPQNQSLIFGFCGDSVVVDSPEIEKMSVDEIKNMSVLIHLNSVSFLGEKLGCAFAKKLLPRLFDKNYKKTPGEEK